MQHDADILIPYLDSVGRKRYPVINHNELIHHASVIRLFQQWLFEQGYPAHLKSLTERAQWVQGNSNYFPEMRYKEALYGRQRIVTGNLRLVVRFVTRVRYEAGVNIHPASKEERLQRGMLGLIRAAESFDPSKECKFSTYAYWWVRQAIAPTRSIDHLIRHPSTVMERRRLVLRSERELTRKLGRDPLLSEIAAELSLPVEKVRKARNAIIYCNSFERDRIPEPQAESPAKIQPNYDLVAQYLSILPEPDDAEIVWLKLGMDGCGYTDQEIAASLGIGVRKMRNRYNQAITYLQQYVVAMEAADLVEWFHHRARSWRSFPKVACVAIDRLVIRILAHAGIA